MRETFISQARSTCEAKQKSCLSKQSLGIALAIKSTLVQFRYHFCVCVECWHLQCSRFLFDVFLLTWAPIRSARSFTLFAWRGKTGKTRLAEQLRGKQLGTGSIPIKQLLHSAEPRENLPHKGHHRGPDLRPWGEKSASVQVTGRQKSDLKQSLHLIFLLTATSRYKLLFCFFFFF